MTYKPREQEQVYESIRDKLRGRIDQLTNFTETSFNYVWTNAYAERFRDAEIALLAAQLSGWADYAGGPITQEDLDRLDVSNVTPEEVNQYIEDDDLDQLAEIVGVTRSDGEFAEGTVEFQTQSQFTTIPSGTSVGTQPDENNEFLEYKTDNEVISEAGDTTETATVTAVEVGSEHNLTGAQVTYLPNPPTGIQGVENITAMSGGEPPESNDEFRTRVKEAIFTTSGGGTAAGVEGFIRGEVEDVVSVNVKEYPGGNTTLASNTPSPGGPGSSSADTPFADVIVEGGDVTEIEDAIAQSRPVAIQHNLVRPNFVTVGINAEVEGGPGVSAPEIEDSLTEFLSFLNLGEAVYRDKIIQRVLNSNSAVSNIDTLQVRVEDEAITYDSDNSGGNAPNHPLYKLTKGDAMHYDSTLDSGSPAETGITDVTAIVNGSETQLDEGTDFDEGTVDGSSPDAIDWGLSGTTPDEDEQFFVDYAITDDIDITEYEKAAPGSINITVI